ncbi:hypothetical protein ACWDSL_44690 [Streptomyces sp. NPDC000941]
MAPTGSDADYAGTRTPRVEDVRLLTGTGTYVDDVVRPCRLSAAGAAGADVRVETELNITCKPAQFGRGPSPRCPRR